MSKRILLICVLSIGFLLLGSVSWCGELRFGVEGGLIYTFPDFDEEEAVLDESGLAAFTAGASVEIPLGDWRSFVTGLRYSRRGHDVRFDTGQDDPTGRHWGDVEITQDYLSLPLLLKVRLLDTPRLFFKAGPEIAFLISAHADGQENKNTGEFTMIMPHDNDDISDELRTACFCVDLAGGVEFPVGRHLASVELRYDYGVAETAKAGRFFSNWQMSGFQAILGMSW